MTVTPHAPMVSTVATGNGNRNDHTERQSMEEEDELTVTTEGAGPSTTAPTAHRDLFGSDDDDEGEAEADLTTESVPTADRMVDRMVDRMADGMADRMADRMVEEEGDKDKDYKEGNKDKDYKDKGDAEEEEENQGASKAPPALDSTLDSTLVVPKVTFPARNAEQHPLFYTKLPNLVGIQTEAFHPDTYSMAAEEDEFHRASYHLIRWRYKDDPASTSTCSTSRESNTRLVEWDDGSYTLHVGQECFPVDALDSSVCSPTTETANTTFAGWNGYLYLSQNAAYTSAATPPTPAGTVLECLGMVQQRLLIRPSSLQSEAHKSLTLGIRQKTMGQVARMTQIVTQEDPERQKQQRIQVRTDLDRAAQRKQRSAAGYSAPRTRPRLSRGYLEEDDDDYDTTRLKDMKRRVMGRGNDDDDDEDMEDYGEDDDEEDTTFRKVRNPRAPRAPAQADSDEDVFLDDDDDDDEDDDLPTAQLTTTTTKKRSHQAVIDDDSD
jgi:RNA polymerase-associated protein LEO1